MACIAVTAPTCSGSHATSLLAIAETNLLEATLVTAFSSAAVAQQFQTVVLCSGPGDHLSSEDIKKAVGCCVRNGAIVLLEPFERSVCKRHALKHGVVSIACEQLLLFGIPFVKLTGRRAAFSTGAKAAIAAAPAAPLDPFKLGRAAGDDAEDDLMDENELLTEEDRKPAAPAAAGDCSTSKKACANCSCGRAEAEAAGVRLALTQEMLDNPQSACGSCALGDAFRCATCPYRGLPTFEPGKKIELPSDFLVADA